MGFLPGTGAWGEQLSLRSQGTRCAEQIKELILSRCDQNCDKSVVDQLDKLLSDATKPVGLLLSERFINVPPQIALPMHQQLQ